MAGSDTDWRAFRAQLVASAAAAATAGSKAEPAAAASLAPAAAGQPWAHSLRAPEQGCLLLSNPLMFQTSQSYFHMAVILIFTHGPDGAAGLILNRWVLLRRLGAAARVSVASANSGGACGGKAGATNLAVLRPQAWRALRLPSPPPAAATPVPLAPHTTGPLPRCLCTLSTPHACLRFPTVGCRPTEYTVGEMGQGAANLQPEFSPCRCDGGGLPQQWAALLSSVKLC